LNSPDAQSGAEFTQLTTDEYVAAATLNIPAVQSGAISVHLTSVRLVELVSITSLPQVVAEALQTTTLVLVAELILYCPALQSISSREHLTRLEDEADASI